MKDLKDVVGYEGLYAVTDCGKVWTYRRKKFMNPATNSTTGYVNVMLRKDGVSKCHYLHRIVAEAFLPNEEGKATVNHKNGNKEDNRVANLEWATHREQRKHSIAKVKEKALTEDNVSFIMNCNLPNTTIAKMFGVTEAEVKRIKEES